MCRPDLFIEQWLFRWRETAFPFPANSVLVAVLHSPANTLTVQDHTRWLSELS